MKIVFWQPIISPHQSFLIKELAEQNDVTLAVLQEISDSRIKQGWKRPDIGKSKVLILKNGQSMTELINLSKSAVNVFSGIARYPVIKDVFKKIKGKESIVVIAEAGSLIGWKKHIRKGLYYIKAIRYNQYINAVFAMGDLGVNWYRSVGFSSDKVFRFQYFTDLPNIKAIGLSQDKGGKNTVKFAFIGQLIHRKGIDNLINAFHQIKDLEWELHIIGDGILRDLIIEKTNNEKTSERIFLHGNLDNQQAMEYLNSYIDYLILPSRFDGWGAVINEAISRGVKVITNDKCGANFLVKELEWGSIYTENSFVNLVDTLENIIINFTPTSIEQRQLIATQFRDRYAYNIVNDFFNIIKHKCRIY